MKKTTFTFLFMAIVGLLSAQSLQFEHNGTVYHNDEVITAQFDPDTYDYTVHMNIRNLTNNDLDVIVEREIIDNLEGTLIYFCWGQCLDPSANMGGPVTIPAQTLSTEDLSFHVMFEEGVYGMVRVRYSAFSRSNPDERISLIVESGNNTSVAENTVYLGSAYPNPASSQVHFDYKANGNANINVVVYNLLGQEVKSQLVNGIQGRINIAVDDLQPGIYFCRFLANTEVVKTEKFIVKR